MDGLAFCYPAKDKLTGKATSLTITGGNEKMRIEGIPFKIIWDKTLPGYASFGGMMRHCGVQFADLTVDQKERLTSLIQDCPEYIAET
jgi:hypothetical protein